MWLHDRQALSSGSAIPNTFTNALTPYTMATTPSNGLAPGISAPTAAPSTTVSTSKPAGTDVGSGQVNTPQGTWYLAGDGKWYLTSDLATQSAPISAGAAQPSTTFSATAPAGTAVGGTMLDTATGQQVQSQIDNAMGDWFFSNASNGWSRFNSFASTGATPGSPLYPGSGAQSQLANAGSGPQVGALSVTINGMTTTNAQMLFGQMVTYLRQIGLKI